MIAEAEHLCLALTDLVSKSAALELDIGGHTVRMGAIAKGSGMIHPDMATMLGVLTCDAAVTPEVWTGIVKRGSINSFNQVMQLPQCSAMLDPLWNFPQMHACVVRHVRLVDRNKAGGYQRRISFKMHPRSATGPKLCLVGAKGMACSNDTLSLLQITVDGDVSTNDTVIGLASGASGAPLISDPESPEAQQLEAAITALLQGMAKSIAWDGEGATCLIQCDVIGAETDADANQVELSLHILPVVVIC